MTKKKQEKIAKRFEMANLVVLLVGILVGIGTTILTIKSSENIAEKSGAFDKPKAQLYLYNIAPRSNDETFLCYGYAFRDSAILIGIIPIVLKNVGEKTIDNLSITFRYPQLLQRKLFEKSIELVTTGISGRGEIKKEVSQIGQFDFVNYLFPRLNPGRAVAVQEPILLFETKVRDEIQIDQSRFAYEAEYLIKLAITVSGTDIPSQDFAISFKTIQCAHINELRDKFQEFADGQAGRIRKNTSFWNYLMLLMRDNFNLALLVYPSLDRMKTDAGNLYVPGERDDEVDLSGYVPCSIRFLFD